MRGLEFLRSLRCHVLGHRWQRWHVPFDLHPGQIIPIPALGLVEQIGGAYLCHRVYCRRCFVVPRRYPAWKETRRPS